MQQDKHQYFAEGFGNQLGAHHQRNGPLNLYVQLCSKAQLEAQGVN